MSRLAVVTGGAGFIGSHLAARLLSDGWRVRALDNFYSGSRDNLADVIGDVELVVGDVRDPDACAKAAAGADTVFHLAAIASVVTSVNEPILSHDVTLGGTLNMLLAARDAGARRLILSSSAAVYGNAQIVPTPESAPIRPMSPYASDKACAEFYCSNFHRLFGLETIALRYFNVFGPRQSANSGYAAAIPKFVEAAITDGRPIVHGDGLQTRDFVYVENVAAANVRAADAENVAGETFNIASGHAISLLDLLAALRAITSSSLEPEFQASRPGDVKHSRADTRRSRDLLGFEPPVAFAEGLGRTVAASRG